jgi:hypothetical protein
VHRSFLGTFTPALLAVSVSLGLPACKPAPRQAARLPGASAEWVPPEPVIPWAPRSYVVYRAARPPVVDGRLDEAAWQAAPWTEDFLDIVGPPKPSPRFRTRAKMLWDSTYLYLAARLDEPDVWATITQRDSVIFRDNDFEVFIDPDGDTHSYIELEVNAYGTPWDLLLAEPYRDDGHAVNGWDIHGLKVGVRVDGTIDLPGDVDRGWSVELAIPWASLRDVAETPSPPRPGDQWRLNFSRVEWKTRVENGRYVKRRDPSTGEPLPEDNWVWSPQGVVNMHYPEMWGFLQFSSLVAGQGTDVFVPRFVDGQKWMLRVLYYRERAFHAAHGYFTDDLDKLRLVLPPRPGAPWGDMTGWPWPPLISVTPDFYEASLPVPGSEDTLRVAGGSGPPVVVPRRLILTSDGAVR